MGADVGASQTDGGGGDVVSHVWALGAGEGNRSSSRQASLSVWSRSTRLPPEDHE